MNWDEYGEGRDEKEPPEVDEGPEPPKAWEAREVDEGPEPPKAREAKEMKEVDDGPEPPKAWEAKEAREVDEGPEPPKAREAREIDDGPEPPKAREAREVKKVNECTEEPEVDEDEEETEKPELEEKDEERRERLNLDKVEKNNEEAKEDGEKESQEHQEERDATERLNDERKERFSEDLEKKEEDEEERKQELPDEREKKGEGTSEPKLEGEADREGIKEENSRDSQFTTSREWGGRKTPGGGWSEYYAETFHARDERTGTTNERTSMFTQGETDQGDKIVGFGRLDGAEFVARLQNDEGWFDDFFVKIESAGVFQSWETDRPVDASIMQFPRGADVKTDLRITTNPDLKDLRAFGQSKEFWTDKEGFPTVRTTRWVIFQRDSEEGKDKPLGEGGSRTSLFGYAKTDEFQLRPGKDDVINRKSSFNMFFPLKGGERQGVGGNAASSTEGKGGEGTGGSPQRVRMLFGDRGSEGQKNDYSFKGEFTEVVYLPIDGDTGDKTEAGDKTSGTTSSSVVEGERASENETAEGAVGKTSGTSDAGETGEDVSVEEDTTENAAVNEAGETSGVSEAGKDVPAEKETAEGAVNEADEASDAGEAKEDVPIEKGNAEDAEESESKSAEGEEASVLVEVGEDGERVTVEDALRLVGKGIFRFGGEREYYEKVGENGVQLDGEKLAKMLFVERRIPKEVYFVLASLGGGDDKREKGEGEQASKIKADTEPDAGVVPESSKEEEEELEENTEETEREPQARERPEEEGQELKLEDIFTIVQNALKGIAYSVSKEEFLKLYGEVVKKKGGEEKVAELLRRMKVGEAKVELLFDMVKNNEVPLEFLGAFLEFVEGTKGVEEKVREIVQKTIKLFKRLGRHLPQEQETGVQDSKVVEGGECGAASVEEELRRKGYAYLGELIGRLLNERGLLDSWIFDLIMMRIKKPSQGREGGEKAKDIMERFREVWEGLGMDPKLKLSPIIVELYEWLGRRDLLLFVYDGRMDPYGRRGRVVSKVDALETLDEAVRKARSEANFLEVVNKRTGRKFFQYSVDAQLAEGRLDEEILRIAVEYVYEEREKIDRRWKLLNGNTDYILKRLMEGAFFFSHLEGMLEPLAELNRRLEQFDQAVLRKEHIEEKERQLEEESAPPNKAQLSDVEVRQEVEGLTPENIEGEKKWLETLGYEKPTVLILGKVFSFSLFSKDVLSMVKEAEKKNKSEGDLVVLRACYEAQNQFEEEECINLYHLLTIAKYLRKGDDETSALDEETEIVPDIYSSELEEIEELLKLLGAKYRITQEGIEVLEALEPHEWVEIPQKHIGYIIKNIKSNENLKTIQKLCDELNKMGLDLKCENLYQNFYLKSMSVGVYLRICHILGIKKDVNLVTGWRRLDVENVGKAEGAWYNNYDIKVRIHPEDLKKLYIELENKLEEEKISLTKFTASLNEAGSNISQVSQILDSKFVDTIVLLEICDFLGRDPKTLRELDHNSLPAEGTVSLPRKVIRLLRSETMKKYKQFKLLAEEINEPTYMVGRYLDGEKGVSIGILKKIEKAIGVEVKDSLHTRRKIGRRDYSREIMGEGGDEWEVMIEKIEIKESDGEKKPLLTFIHRRDKEGGGITTEVPQTGEIAESTKTPWWLSYPNTNITIDRAKEFKEGKDLLTYITEKCVDKAGSAWKLAKILDISEHTPERLLKDKENDTLSLRLLLALAMFSDEIKKLSELTDYVERVGIIEKKQKPNLTIDWNNPEGAHIILNIHGDGGFRKIRKWGYVIYYMNSHIDFVNTFIDNVEKVCGITSTIKKSDLYYVRIISNLVGTSLIRAGVKPGKKTRTNPKIPKFIIEGSTQIRKAATNAITADEGNTHDAQLRIANCVDVPELEQYRNTLNQIEGSTNTLPGGAVCNTIDIGKLEGHNEILNVIKTKQSNILQGVKNIIGSLLEEHGTRLEEKDLEITTLAIQVYSNHISISKQIELSMEATRKLHQILGGFLGYKELMYANHVSARRWLPRIRLRLSEKEVEILKKIGTRRIINSRVYYAVPVEKLPEELKQYANPPDEILRMQKEYFEEEVEILIEGNPIIVKGMPSRISGEIILGLNKNVISWRLIPVLVDEIKKKWESLKNILNEGKGK